jgi:Phosphotransferase enzyme family
MNDLPQIKEIDSTLLTDPVRQALGSTNAEIRQWEHQPIRYIVTETANLGLHRFMGTARDRGVDRDWSIVLKAVEAPESQADSTSWNYHRREILAYEEGLLAELSGDVCAPRCLGINKYPGGICWLWLEDVQNPASQSWSLAEYGQVARHLGRFNGAYLTGQPLPNRPWLSRHWIRGWLSFYDETSREVLDRIQEEGFLEQPRLRSAFGQGFKEDVSHLWTSYEALFAALDQLPQTFCHLDAYRPNLFLRRDRHGSDQTVAVDWVFTGIAAVGEEIANLLAASLIWFEYDAVEARKLDEAVFSGYLDGLREAGWQGDSRIVRLGYTAACALRWGIVGLWWMRSLGNAGKEAELESHWNHPLPELISQWTQTINYLLGLAQEAYRLIKIVRPQA